MKLSITAQLPQKGGGFEGKVLFIDTEGTFSAERVYQIARGIQLQPEKILEEILCARVYNSGQQVLAVDQAFKLCQEEKVKLLAVDWQISRPLTLLWSRSRSLVKIPEARSCIWRRET
jgi:DNA repair protein RadA